MKAKTAIKNDRTKKSILTHFNNYPKMELYDMLKFLFHSAFGCDHLVNSLEKAEEYINFELNALNPTISKIEKLDGNYSRLYLGIINKGLSVKTLAKLFYLSAKKENNATHLLEQKLKVLETIILNKELPFNHSEFLSICNEWKNANYPAIRHSKTFNQEYKPSYRVISNKFIPYLALLKKIDFNLKNKNCNKFNLKLCNNLQKKQEEVIEILAQIYSDFNLKICFVNDSTNKYLSIHRR